MIKQRTVFIIGAGASVEFGMPVGAELAKVIANKMDIRFEDFNNHVGDGDIQLFEQIVQNDRTYANSFQQAAWKIRDGLPFVSSIDDFLDIHNSDQIIKKYGKAAIVKAILEAESSSSLYGSEDLDVRDFAPHKFPETWITSLFQVLSRGVSRENMETIFENISFIVFNYDRCIEHFLENALQRLYHLDRSKAVDLMKKLKIIHPYGSLDMTFFGQSRANYYTISDKIKTYTERLDDNATVEIIKKEVACAKAVVFLGFAYHEQNMKLIAPNAPVEGQTVIGTAYRMSNLDMQTATRQISSWHSSASSISVNLEQMTCAQLLRDYAKLLTSTIT